MTELEHSELNHFPIMSLDSGIDVPRSGRNIDNHTVMNPQGLIVTTIQESNIAKNCKILNLVSRESDISYRGSLWHSTTKIESENLVENLKGNKIFKKAEHEKN